MDIIAQWNYTRLRQIGVGAGRNSQVFVVHDPQRNAEIVVKEIDKSTIADPAKLFSESQAMVAAASPFVVPLYCAAQTPDKICLGMPLYQNGSLADRITTDPLPPREIIRIGLDVLSGIGAIHAKGLIHFDVKPTNILFDDTGTAMVADFGQACALGPAGTAAIPGLYVYSVPPEAFTHGTGVPQSDIYQMGSTLYRMSNGNPHFKRQLPGHRILLETLTLNGKFPDRDAFQPHVPRQLRTLIRKALQVDPSDRFPTAAAMADALGKITVKCNWQMRTATSGERSWRCDRTGQASIVVEEKLNGASRNVEIWTISAGNKRAKDRQSWKRNLSPADSHKALKSIFESLER